MMKQTEWEELTGGADWAWMEGDPPWGPGNPIYDASSLDPSYLRALQRNDMEIKRANWKARRERERNALSGSSPNETWSTIGSNSDLTGLEDAQSLSMSISEHQTSPRPEVEDELPPLPIWTVTPVKADEISPSPTPSSHPVHASAIPTQLGSTTSPRGLVSEGRRYVPTETSPCENLPPPPAPRRFRSTKGRSKPHQFARPRRLESVPLLDLGDKTLTPLRLDKWLHHLQFIMTDHCPGLNPQDQARMLFYNVREGSNQHKLMEFIQDQQPTLPQVIAWIESHMLCPVDRFKTEREAVGIFWKMGQETLMEYKDRLLSLMQEAAQTRDLPPSELTRAANRFLFGLPRGCKSFLLDRPDQYPRGDLNALYEGAVAWYNGHVYLRFSELDDEYHNGPQSFEDSETEDLFLDDSSSTTSPLVCKGCGEGGHRLSQCPSKELPMSQVWTPETQASGLCGPNHHLE